MRLSDYIKKHHKGIQSHFAAFHGIPASRVNELLKSQRTAFVFEYIDEDGSLALNIFKRGRKLKKCEGGL